MKHTFMSRIGDYFIEGLTRLIPNNQPQYKQTAAGVGLMGYELGRESRTLEIYLSYRTELAGKGDGEGLGLTDGGFFECAATALKPTGTITPVIGDVIREGEEEIPGIETHIPGAMIARYAQPMDAFAVTAHDKFGNETHFCVQHGLHLSPAEAAWLMSAPPSDERHGGMLKVTLSWGADIERILDDPMVAVIKMRDAEGKEYTRESFFHQHEWYGYALLALHAEHGWLRLRKEVINV